MAKKTEQIQKPKFAPTCRYLTSLNLKNVRAFGPDTQINFCNPDGKVAQWTVLLGENGTGKTTILQQIALLQPAVQLFSHGEAKKKESLCEPVGAGSDWNPWHFSNIRRPWEHPMIVEVQSRLTDPSISLASSKTTQHKPYGYNLYPLKHSAGVGGEMFLWGPSLMNEFFVLGFGAGRHVASPDSPYLTRSYFGNVSNQTITLFEDDRPLISPEQWLLGLDHASKTASSGQEAAKRSLEQAKKCLISVLPDISEVSIEPFPVRESQQGLISVLFKTPFGQVPFSSLSLGFRTMAAWLIEFLRYMHDRYRDWEAPETGPAVLLIDEFDLHMHPR